MGTAKKEIDKELMYKKIMPSSLRPHNPTEPTEQKSYSLRPAVEGTPHLIPDAPPIRKAPLKPETGGVQIKSGNSTVLVNIMERLVVDKLDIAFSKFNCCKCDRCRKDVAAIALNKLKPKYVVTSSQEAMEAMASRQTNAEVYTALVQAILIVKSKPRH